jgi:hypothetical protein
MLPIRPINEELCRLHQPVVSAEEEDRWDVSIQRCLLVAITSFRGLFSLVNVTFPLALQTALEGFSVTSVVSRPQAYGAVRRSSDSSRSAAVVPHSYHPRNTISHYTQPRSFGPAGYTLVYPVNKATMEPPRPHPHYVRYTAHGSPRSGYPRAW